MFISLNRNAPEPVKTHDLHSQRPFRGSCSSWPSASLYSARCQMGGLQAVSLSYPRIHFLTLCLQTSAHIILSKSFPKGQQWPPGQIQRLLLGPSRLVSSRDTKDLLMVMVVHFTSPHSLPCLGPLIFYRQCEGWGWGSGLTLFLLQFKLMPEWPECQLHRTPAVWAWAAYFI